jgi:hypothetical protein
MPPPATIPKVAEAPGFVAPVLSSKFLFLFRLAKTGWRDHIKSGATIDRGRPDDPLKPMRQPRILAKMAIVDL